MSTNDDAGQEPTDGGGQEPDTTSRTATGQEPPLDKLVSELRKENAARRIQVTKLEASVKAYEDAKLSEAERLANQVATLTAERDNALSVASHRIATAELKLAAQTAGFIDPSDAVALIGAGNVLFTDDGEPANTNDLVAALAASKPHLIAAPAAPAPTGGGPSLPGKASGLTTSAFLRMTKEEVAKLPADERRAAIRRAANE
jgi:hypothetical protein